jgi:AcrR family transcriptional regulator
MADQGARRNAWDELEPAGMAEAGAGWQQRKSAQTRIAVLEAAMECLATQGYSRTTTQLIAQKANISRGAMLHHYATKQELIESVIDYTFFKRVERFVEDIRSLSEAERVQQQVGIELFWRSLLTPEYEAYLELAIAARTDEELRGLFEPKAKRFDRIWREQIHQLFPEWEGKRAELDLAIDFCLSAMEGLLLNRSIFEPRDRRVAVRKMVTTAIFMLREGVLKV